jgi:hypothetical protein
MGSRDDVMHCNIGRKTMSTYKIYKIAGVSAAVAGVALMGFVAGGARAEKEVGDVYKPAQGIIETFGSKHAIGYFARQDGACAMTLFLAEATSDGERVPTAARVRLNVKAGDKAELGAVEGQSLELACGADAASVEIRHGNFKAAYVTQ